MQLDSSQRAFCEAPVGHLRLLAPAGCGKTMSLLYRCKSLAERSTSQRPRFLIVTFTVAAKQELQSRLNGDAAFDQLRDMVEITTLNSWGFRRIRGFVHSPKLLVSKQDYHFAMNNQLQPVWREHEAVRAGIAAAPHQTPRRLMNVMDGFKSIGFDHIRHAQYESFREHLDFLRGQGLSWKMQELTNELAKVGILQVLMSRQGAEKVDASDKRLYSDFFRFWRDATAHLISNATFTLEDQKYFAFIDEKQKLEDGKFLSGAARYDYVLVDEFQDINPLDLALIKAITLRNKAILTIVGDDDQAIFEWRGATPEYILNPDRFLGLQFGTHTLSINYRSPANIVTLSQRLISHNTRREAKAISPFRTDNATIRIEKTETLFEALELVYDLVKTRISKGDSPSRVAIIGRKRSQLIPYQVFFASKDVPFCAAEDLQVFMGGAFDRLLKLVLIKGRASYVRSRSEIVDDMLELCNLVKRYPLNKNDRESVRRHLQQSGATSLPEAIAALANYSGPLKGSNSSRQISLGMAEAIRHFVSAETVSASLLTLGESFEGLQLDLGKAEDDIFYSDPPFAQLAEYSVQYGPDYGRFVDDIERAKDQLAYIPPFEEENLSGGVEELWKRPLHLMTALRAKGKEFDSVILLDTVDGIWPNKNAQTPLEREAERRVFYVAFTRARFEILILYRDRIGSRQVSVSPYLQELGLTLP